MDKYRVVIGQEYFTVEAEDNFRARYEAAVKFRDRHNLSNPLGEIVAHAKARVITDPVSETATKEVLAALRKGE